MARAIWRGTISFGMVSIPVKLYTATDSQDVSFRQLHAADNSPIRLVKRCATDGKDLEADEIVKGFEYAKEHFVLIDDEDLEKLPIPSKHTIELTAFVKAEEIDPVYYEKSYYVEPEELGRKPFALLMKALESKELTAVAKIAIRTKERLCALRPGAGGLVLETLFYADEIREPESEMPEMKVSEAEMKVAYALIDLLQESFDPPKYKDEYRDALMQIIEAKLEGHEFVAPEAPAAASPSVDLMAALKASVEAAKKRKDGGAPEKAADEEEKPAAKPSRSRKKTPVAAG
jgi:DNA end-binding protein Ku